jgi:8-oxo-dGTP diphosphatase
MPNSDTVRTQYGNRLRTRVCGLCRQGDKLLMLKHKGMLNESGIFWGPPGGGLEFGEKIADALIREFQEETHLQITVGDMLYVCEYVSPPLHAIEIFFEVKIVSGNLQVGHDPETSENLLEALEWLSFEEIKAIKKEELHQIFYNCTNLEDVFLRQGFIHLPNGSKI